MHDGRELPGHLAAHPLGWRVRCHKLRVTGLEGAQLPHQGVILGVGENRVVKHVIGVVGLFDASTKRGNALLDRLPFFNHHSPDALVVLLF